MYMEYSGVMCLYVWTTEVVCVCMYGLERCDVCVCMSTVWKRLLSRVCTHVAHRIEWCDVSIYIE